MIKLIIDKEEKRKITKTILENLPEWFGIPESTNNYIETSVDKPFFAFFDKGDPIGFIMLKETSESTAEIYCMGVLKEYHRKGIGRTLFSSFENFAKNEGYKFLQVKTVKTGIDKEYDKTNLFYKSVSFYELEVFPNLWDENNPCQIYVKCLKQ